MRWLFILLVKIYQRVVSPCLPPACRFTPTCSHYSIQAFERFGVLKGFLLTIWRILRCQPWSDGGPDPVPDEFSIIDHLQKVYHRAKEKLWKSA